MIYLTQSDTKKKSVTKKYQRIAISRSHTDSHSPFVSLCDLGAEPRPSFRPSKKAAAVGQQSTAPEPMNAVWHLGEASCISSIKFPDDVLYTVCIHIIIYIYAYTYHMVYHMLFGLNTLNTSRLNRIGEKPTNKSWLKNPNCQSPCRSTECWLVVVLSHAKCFSMCPHGPLHSQKTQDSVSISEASKQQKTWVFFFFFLLFFSFFFFFSLSSSAQFYALLTTIWQQ